MRSGPFRKIASRFRKLRDDLTESYWFYPALISIFYFLVAVFANFIDDRFSQELRSNIRWLYSGKAVSGASAIFSVIATSTMTVAGVIFSVMIVAISLTISQYGPRVLNSFMRDKGTQWVQGIFIGTFLYCLVCLASMRESDNTTSFQFSATLAMFFSAVAGGAFIYFLHHASRIIRISNLAKNISKELMEAADSLFPDTLGKAAKEEEVSKSISGGGLPRQEGQDLSAHRSGYIVLIEEEKLMESLCQKNLLLEIHKTPGEFVMKGEALASLRNKPVDKKGKQELENFFVLEDRRSPYQDIGLPIFELVEIALRALSPGVNDPFTAMLCIDYLGEALCCLSTRAMPSRERFDSEGCLRIMTPALSFDDLLENAFGQIFIYGRRDPRIVEYLLNWIQRISAGAKSKKYKDTLERYREIFYRNYEDANALAPQKDRVDKAFLASRENKG